MNDNTSNNSQPKRRLTKEELLAGHCEPAEEAQANSDPRIKNPDELLMRLLAQKKMSGASQNNAPQPQKIEANAPVHNPAPQKASPEPEEQNNHVTAAHPIHELNLEEIQNKKWLALKEMYDRDMARWKEYEQNVSHWRDKVLQIVQRLQNELSAAKSLQSEVDALKSALKARDEEIAKFKKNRS